MKQETKILLMFFLVRTIGFGSFRVFLTLYLYDLGATYFQIAILESLSGAMYLASRIFGAISDYYGVRKTFIIIGHILSVLPVFLCYFTQVLNLIIVLYMLSSFFWSIGLPSFLAALTCVEEKGKVLGWYGLISYIGWATGSFLMGYLYEFQKASNVFIFSSGIMALSTLFIAFYPKEPRLSQRENLWSYVRPALTLRFRAPTQFKWFLLTVFLSWIGLQWAWPLLELRMYDLFERSKAFYGVVWGLSSGIISGIASISAGRVSDKIGGARVVQIIIVIYIFLIPTFAFLTDPIIYAILWSIPIWSFFEIGSLAVPAQTVNKGSQAEAMGALDSSAKLGVFISFIGGIFADKFGREAAIIITSVFLVVSLPSLQPIIKFYKKKKKY